MKRINLFLIVIFFIIGSDLSAQHFNTNDFELHLRANVPAHKGRVEFISFSPNGDRIVTGGHDAKIQVWNPENARLLQTLEEHSNVVNHICFSRDGRLMASASDDGTVKLWDSQTGKLLKNYISPSRKVLQVGVYFVTFGPQEEYLYFGGQNCGIARINIQNNSRKPEVLWQGSEYITAGVVSPDQQFLVFATNKSIKFLSLSNNQINRSIDDNPNYVNDLQFSHNSKMLAAWCQDGTLRFWSYPQHELLGSISAGGNDYSHIAFSNDDRLIVSGNSARSFKVWDVSDRTLFLEVMEHRDKVRTFAFHPIANYLVSGSYDGTVKIWETVVKKPIAQPKPPTPKIAPSPPPVVQEPKKERIVTKVTTLPKAQPQLAQKTAPPPKPKASTIPKFTPQTSSQPMPKAHKNRRVKAKATVHLKSPDVTLQVWDDETVDGDIISLFFNGECILKEYKLKKRQKTLRISVAPNSVNNLVLYAHNIGERPPNTAAIFISDGNKKRKINLSSDMQASEAVNILFYP